MVKMAACIELLKKSFPKIEGELQEYVSSKFLSSLPSSPTFFLT